MAWQVWLSRLCQLRALRLDTRAQLGGLRLGTLGAHRRAAKDTHGLLLQRAVRRRPRLRVGRRLLLGHGAQPRVVVREGGLGGLLVGDDEDRLPLGAAAADAQGPQPLHTWSRSRYTRGVELQPLNTWSRSR